MSFRLKSIPWYMENTTQLQKVTNLPQNLELGINDITVFPPTEEQFEDGVICAVQLLTPIGMHACEIIEAGTHKLGIRELKEYKFNRCVEAQILRFITTQVEFVHDEYPNPSII